MKLEITPEPTPEEREAIEQALAALATLDGRPPAAAAGRGEWWRQGLRAALEDDEEAPAG